MAKLTIYKLHFTAPLHLSDVRDDYSVSLRTIFSDTMYAALIACLAKYGQDVPKNGDLGCTISSLFPFYQKNRDTEHILFFPKPLKQSVPKLSDVANAKKIKKVQWLDLQYFSDVINGKNIFNDNAVRDCHDDFLTHSEGFDSGFMTSEITERVTISSRTGQDDAEPFYMDRLHFKDFAGMYFVAEGDVALLEKALNHLQNEGIGTDRNVGNGFFEVEKSCAEINIPESSEFALSLSTFVPENESQLKDMLSSDDVAYDFQRRGGWLTDYHQNTFRKNSVYAFVSGSVLKKNINYAECIGKVDTDLKPQISFSNIGHPVWRCGRAIFLPIKLG